MTDQLPITYDAARQAIAEARSFVEVRDIRDRAEALKRYAQMAQNRELEIKAAEIRVRAERRLGEMLVEIKAAGGLDRTANLRSSSGELRDSGEPDFPVTLKELDIDKKLSMRAQQMAALPEADFEARLAAWREAETARAARGLASLFKAVTRPAAPAETPPLPDGQYRVIYADPPWRFESWGPGGMDRAAENHYPTMPTGDICALPVGQLAAPDCALFLWARAPMLPAALTVMAAWGFTYKTLAFTWAKVAERTGKGQMGNGYWTRANAELCLLGTRGNIARRPEATDIAQLVTAPRGRHSEKPEEVPARIEQLVAGPYVELFYRTERQGWDSWGHQAGGVS